MTEHVNRRPVDADHLGNSYSPDLLGRRDRSIFDVDVHWRRDLSPLPGILVTEQTAESLEIEDTNALYTTPHGARYPILWFPDESPQPADQAARAFGYSYYYEGLCTPAEDNLGKRIDCFRASELLYLHAIARGNTHAHVGLGLIYAGDLAEGHYFDALKNNLFADAVLPAEEIRLKAHEHLRHAAAHDDVEGVYLFGDALREGLGCEKDLGGAYQCYQRAWRMLQEAGRATDAYLGNVAWRLGRAHEEGEGCPCDFAIALQWYETAALKLEQVVDTGMWFFDLELAGARRGAKRMRQELALREDDPTC